MMHTLQVCRGKKVSERNVLFCGIAPETVPVHPKAVRSVGGRIHHGTRAPSVSRHPSQVHPQSLQLQHPSQLARAPHPRVPTAAPSPAQRGRANPPWRAGLPSPHLGAPAEPTPASKRARLALPGCRRERRCFSAELCQLVTLPAREPCPTSQPSWDPSPAVQLCSPIKLYLRTQNVLTHISEK